MPLPPVAWRQVPSASTVQMWLSGRLPFSAYAALTEKATVAPSGETATAPGRRSSRNCAASSSGACPLLDCHGAHLIIEPVTALYRTYRPQDFDEVVGQEPVVRTLQNAIASGQLRQAYLFAGPRGHGQDLARTHPGEGAELRAGAHAESRQDLPRLPGDRERQLARRRGDGRGLAARDRRHPRDPRARRAAACGRALQGLHPRRGAPAHGRGLERAAQADRGASSPSRLRLLHHRPRQGAADRPVALPDLRLLAAAPARARPATSGGSRTAKGSRLPTQPSR